MSETYERVSQQLRESESSNQLLLEILTELKRLNASGRDAVSSCKIALQRGTVDVAVHAYAGSDIDEAVDDALRSYRYVIVELNQEGVAGFERTLEALKKS